jgi:hypothetical protein
MTSADIPKMQDLLKALPIAEKEVAEAEALQRVLHLKGGQEGVSCYVGGLRISLVYMNSQTGYMPREVPGRQALLALLRKEAHDHLLLCRSKVEGIQFQIRRLAKGGAA